MKELAVRSLHDQKVVGSNLAGSKSDLTNIICNDDYNVIINSHGWMVTINGIQTYLNIDE